MKDAVIRNILENKLIVIIRGVEDEKLLPLVKAMYDGGVRLVELTYDNSGKVEDEHTAENIAMLKKYFGDIMNIGAGTVTSTSRVELTHKAGGEFIISPDVNGDVIKATVNSDMVSIPGALTPTEIQNAQNCGADFVKLFPVTSMGPEYVKAVKAPLSNVRMLAVGGVNLENIPEYLKCGVCGFGLGSNIIDKKLLAASDYEAITALAEKYVKAVRG